MFHNRSFIAALLAGAASLTAVAAHAQTDSGLFSGAYVGIVGGYSDGKYNVKGAALDASPASTFFGPYSGTTSNTGGRFQATGKEAGGTAGWNYQSGHLVAGVEGDLAWSGDDGQRTIAGTPGSPYAAVFDADTKYTATLRARLGYASGPFLLYGTGGLAMQDVDVARSYVNGTTTVNGETAARTYTGFTYGGGAEFAINKKVSFKAEYLRLDTGSELYRTGFRDGVANTFASSSTAKIEHDRDLYRVGFNYHF